MWDNRKGIKIRREAKKELKNKLKKIVMEMRKGAAERDKKKDFR